MLFANVYGIGQTLPDSSCTYPGLLARLHPSLDNDLAVAEYVTNPPSRVHLTMSSSALDLARPATILPAMQRLETGCRMRGQPGQAGRVRQRPRADATGGHRSEVLRTCPSHPRTAVNDRRASFRTWSVSRLSPGTVKSRVTVLRSRNWCHQFFFSLCRGSQRRCLGSTNRSEVDVEQSMVNFLEATSPAPEMRLAYVPPLELTTSTRVGDGPGRASVRECRRARHAVEG